MMRVNTDLSMSQKFPTWPEFEHTTPEFRDWHFATYAISPVKFFFLPIIVDYNNNVRVLVFYGIALQKSENACITHEKRLKDTVRSSEYHSQLGNRTRARTSDSSRARTGILGLRPDRIGEKISSVAAVLGHKQESRNDPPTMPLKTTTAVILNHMKEDNQIKFRLKMAVFCFESRLEEV